MATVNSPTAPGTDAIMSGHRQEEDSAEDGTEISNRVEHPNAPSEHVSTPELPDTASAIERSPSLSIRPNEPDADLIGADLVYHADLTKLSLAYHPGLCILICTKCHQGVRSKIRTIAHHIRSNHPLFEDKPNWTALVARVQDAFPEAHASTNPRIPGPESGLICAVKGLEIQEGHACRYCPYVCPKLSAMAPHIRNHRDGERTAFPQTLGFQVRLPEHRIVATFDVLLRAALAAVPRIDVSAQGTSRDLTPFLRRYDWISHVQGYEIVDLMALVDIQTEDEQLRLLEELMHRWMTDVDRDLSTGNLRMCRLLGLIAEDATEGYFRILEPRMMSSATMIFTRFLFFVIRLHRSSTRGTFATETSVGYAFTLSDEVATRVDYLLECLDSELDADQAIRAIEGVVVGLLKDHPTGALRDIYRYPIQRFLCLYHLKDDGGFQPVYTVTETLAAILWIVRAILYSNIMATLDVRTEWDRAKQTAFLSSRMALISDDPKQFTSFTTVLDMQHLADYLVSVGPRLPKCSWQDPERTVLTVNGATLSIAGLRTMVESLTKEAQGLLDGLCFDKIWSIPDHLTDILPNDQTGFSFVSHNKLDGLALDMLRTVTQLSEFHGGIQDGKILWTMPVVQKYLAESRKLLNVLGPLIHITSGSPACGEELCTAKIVNTPNALRNVFLVEGRINLILQDHNTRDISGTDKLIFIGLPHSVSNLIVRYMTLVRPLEVYFTSVVHPGSSHSETLGTYLFADSDGNLWTGDSLSNQLQIHMIKHCQAPVGAADWRHAVKLIQQRDQLDSLQSPATARTHYGLDVTSMSFLDATVLHAYQNASRSWHRLLHCELVQPGAPPSRAVASVSLEPVRGPIDMAHLAKLVAAELKPLLPSDMIPRANPRPSGRSSPLGLTPPANSTAFEQFSIVPTPPPLPLMSAHILAIQQLFGSKQTSFQSREQVQACLFALECERDMLVILPAGTTKSLIWMLLPILEPDDCTVLIVPVRSLLNEFLATMTQIGERLNRVLAQRWEGLQHSSLSSCLILVSAEEAGRPDFIAWAKSLRKLKRVVVEEAQLMVYSSHLPMVNLKPLRTLGVPCVLITAICPFAFVHPLLEFMQINSAIRISAPVHNPGHSYFVHTKCSGLRSLTEAIVRLVNFWFDNGVVSSKGRVVIFVQPSYSYSYIEVLANSIGAGYYHDGMNPIEKRQIMDGFRKVEPSVVERVLCCTSALDYGVNLPVLEAVIHVGIPDNMMTFLKDVGRAGQGGTRAISYIFPTVLSSRAESDITGRQVISDYSQPATVAVCRRRTISEFLDGQEDSCFTGSVAPCDVCCLQMGQLSSLIPRPYGPLEVPERLHLATSRLAPGPTGNRIGRVEPRFQPTEFVPPTRKRAGPVDVSERWVRPRILTSGSPEFTLISASSSGSILPG